MNIFDKKNLGFIWGSFFILLSIIFYFFLAQYFTRLPRDFNFTANIISVDNFFDENKNDYIGEIYSKTNYNYVTTKSGEDTLTIKNTFDVRTPEDNPIFSVEREYEVNRFTGEHVMGMGDRDRSGFLFAPRNLIKGQSFTYWHINYDGPANMIYVGEEKLFGLDTYHYRTDYSGVDIDQTNNLTFLPEVGVTRGVRVKPILDIWVEPVLGRLVKYKDNTIAYYYDLKTGENIAPWNHFSNTIREESVRNIAEIVGVERSNYYVFNYVIPTILLIIGLFFIIINFINIGIISITKKSFYDIISTVTAITGISILLIKFFELNFLKEISIFGAMGLIALSMGPILKSRYRNISLLYSFILIAIYFVVLLNIFGFISYNSNISHVIGISFLIFAMTSIFSDQYKIKNFHIVEILSVINMLMLMFSVLVYTFNYFDLLPVTYFDPGSIYLLTILLLNSFVMRIYLYSESEKSLNDHVLSRTNNLIIFIILLLSVSLTLLLAGLAEKAILTQAKTLFRSEADNIANSITDRISIYKNTLQGSRGLFDASKSVERNEWKKYVEALQVQKNYPGIQGVGYAPYLKDNDLVSHLDYVRSEGFDGYIVFPESSEYAKTPVMYIEPFEGRNLKAFGYDMFSEYNRRFAMEQARDTGDAKISGKVILLQEDNTNTQPGFLMYLPLYSSQSVPGSILERREEILGYVYSPFRASDFIKGTLHLYNNNLGFKIDDGVNIREETLMYKTPNLDSILSTSDYLEDTRTIYVGDRPWTITFYANTNFGKNLISNLAPLVMIILGSGISVLLSIIFYILISSRQRAVMYAEELNRDLIESNNSLTSSQSEIVKRIEEVERMNKLMVDRELKMLELKKKINNLGEK